MSIKLKSASVIGVLALIGVVSLSPLSAPSRIRETLRLVKLDPRGNVVSTNKVEQIVKASDPQFAQKLKLARVLVGEKSWLAYLERWVGPSAAEALIVNAGETALRGCFMATSCVAVQAFKYHGLGTGNTAAAETDTGCQTELTTVYNPDNTRATGSQENADTGGSAVYRTVGTNTVDNTAAITEWCLMSQAATGGGTMWSRVVFTTINLGNGDSLQTTYDLTIE